MEWGTVMGVITLVLLLAYLGVVLWAFNRTRKADFEEAARAPLFDDGDPR